MNSKSKQKKITLIVVIIAVVLVAAAVVCWVLFRPGTEQGSKQLTVEVQHTDGTENSITVNTDEEYLRPALEAYDLIEGEESEYGLFVQTVDGEFADGDAGTYWMYDINGAMAEYGVDSQPIADGDVILFYTVTY